jgi:hypothetical protein
MTISLKDYCQLMKLIKKIGNRWYISSILNVDQEGLDH